MKLHYDYLFVTHLPAFYKVNLYNHLAKMCSLFVIFISESSSLRTSDFTHKQFAFDYVILNKNAFEERNRLKSLVALQRILNTISFQKMVVGGWDLPEFWYLVITHPKRANYLALESSIFECSLKGYRYGLKKLFLSRISLVFPSGSPHRALLKALKYTGEMKTTLGVGVFNYQEKKSLNKTFSGRFLYVGRFSFEKNLHLLLKVFAQLPEYHLTLIGQGPLKAELQALKPPNVMIKEHIPNELLFHEYLQHDIFILPSLREPWGLVIEEALFYGLPVIASNQVGSALDLVQHFKAGALFSPTDPLSLQNALDFVKTHFQELLHNVQAIDFKARDKSQITQYLEALS